MTKQRQLAVQKGEERFVFRYYPGQEARVIDSFSFLAGDGKSAFDWFDAAVLSYQMGRGLAVELDSIADNTPIP